MERLPLINTQFTLFGGHKETVQPGWHWKPEAHLAFELMYIIAGTQRTESEIGELVVHAGEFIIIPYGIRHNNFAIGETPLTYFAVHFNLEEPTLKYLLTRQFSNRIIKAGDEAYEGLKRHALQLIDQFRPEYSLTDKLNIQVTMINLIAFLVNMVQKDTHFDVRETNINQFLLCQKIAGDMKKQLDNQIYYASEPTRISVAKIVSKYNISPSYALDLFRKFYQKSPQAYLIDLKLEAAKNLLRQPQTQISQVAERLAYSDASHFSREFKKHFGVAPRAWSKAL